jgi:hypothetical protein
MPHYVCFTINAFVSQEQLYSDIAVNFYYVKSILFQVQHAKESIPVNFVINLLTMTSLSFVSQEHIYSDIAVTLYFVKSILFQMQHAKESLPTNFVINLLEMTSLSLILFF